MICVSIYVLLFPTSRHAAFLALLSTLAPNPTSALPAVKAAARGYRAGESSARDLIGIVWSVLDKDKTGTFETTILLT